MFWEFFFNQDYLPKTLWGCSGWMNCNGFKQVHFLFLVCSESVWNESIFLLTPKALFAWAAMNFSLWLSHCWQEISKNILTLAYWVILCQHCIWAISENSYERQVKNTPLIWYLQRMSPIWKLAKMGRLNEVSLKEEGSILLFASPTFNRWRNFVRKHFIISYP